MHNETFSVVALCASNKLIRPREATIETQPQLQPALLRLSAIISQHFIDAERGSSYQNKRVELYPFFCASEATIFSKRVQRLKTTFQRRLIPPWLYRRSKGLGLSRPGLSITT